MRRDHVLAALGCLLDNALVHGAGTVSVSTRRHDRTVDVVVTDEGPGVPADLRDSIFERLISGARSSGIGLGLARALTTTERGTLRLEPPATFVLTLPIDEPAPSRQHDTASLNSALDERARRHRRGRNDNN